MPFWCRRRVWGLRHEKNRVTCTLRHLNWQRTTTIGAGSGGHAAVQSISLLGTPRSRSSRPAEQRSRHPGAASTCCRRHSPHFYGTRAGLRSRVFDSAARFVGTDPQQISQELHGVPIAGVCGEATALGFGDGRAHGSIQSPLAAFGFDECAQQVDVGQFRPSWCWSIRRKCDRMYVHPSQPTSE